MLRVNNITHLLTKPDQVAKSGKLERKPKQPKRQNQRENKMKKSKLAYWINYNKAVIPWSPRWVPYCQIFKMGCLKYHIFRISSVAHHNSYINAIFVYLFMQELFVGKIHFFKFLCMSHKPRQNITATAKYYHFFS